MSGPTADGIGSRQRWLLFGVSFVVIGTDQAVKWWAWRYFDGTLINSGGYILLGPVVRSWYSGPVSGAVLDVCGGVLLLGGIHLLLLRQRATGVLVGCGLMAAGWVSNLADRLVLHYWTAPGSVRGVVDFIPSGGTSRCNVADLWIVAGAVLLVGTAARRGWAVTPPERGQPRTSLAHGGAHRASGAAALIAVLALAALAVLGALRHGGVEAPAGMAPA